MRPYRDRRDGFETLLAIVTFAGCLVLLALTVLSVVDAYR